MDAIPNFQSIQTAMQNLWDNAPAEIQQEYLERSRERVAHRQIVVDVMMVEDVWFEEEDGEEHPDEHENDDGYDSDSDSDCTLAESDYSSDEETDVEDETVEYAIDPEEDFAVDDGLAAMDLMDLEMAEAADLEEALNWGVQFYPVPNNGEDGQPIPFEIGFYY